MIVGPYNDIDVFRMFHPSTGDVTFWGDSFNLREIVAEVQRILPAVVKEADKPPWDTREEPGRRPSDGVSETDDG